MKAVIGSVIAFTLVSQVMTSIANNIQKDSQGLDNGAKYEAIYTDYQGN